MYVFRLREIALLACVTFLPASACTAQQLIPRAALFGNPERANAQLSPDGTRIAFLAPVNGVLNVWVASIAAVWAANTQEKQLP